jgi:hypothetical protein
MKECCLLVANHTLASNGYARTKEAGVGGYLHRKAWEKYHGRKVPKGKWVLHHCDVRPCIRESHLYLGTGLDNVADRVRRNRSAVNRICLKLSNQQVRLIRSSRATARMLAHRTGVSTSMIYQIRSGRKWATMQT